jgi:exonuclease VII large subunit
MLRNTYQILIDKINQYLNYYTNSVERYFAKLSSIDYHKIVNQGFAVIRDKNGKVVLSKNNVVVGDSISIEVQDGKINVIVE